MVFLTRIEYPRDLFALEDACMHSTERFAPEVRERAARLVFDHVNGYGSRWARVAAIAPNFGCTAQTLRGWVKLAQIDQGCVNGVWWHEHDRMKALERENRELKRANEILRKVSAHFARAQLLATQWLYSDNNERPNTAIVGVLPSWLLKAAQASRKVPVKNGGITTVKNLVGIAGCG